MGMSREARNALGALRREGRLQRVEVRPQECQRCEESGADALIFNPLGNHPDESIFIHWDTCRIPGDEVA